MPDDIPPEVVERCRVLAFLHLLRERARESLTGDPARAVDQCLTLCIHEIAGGAHSQMPVTVEREPGSVH